MQKSHKYCTHGHSIQFEFKTHEFKGKENGLETDFKRTELHLWYDSAPVV